MTVVPRLGLRLFVGLTLLNASLADAYEAETHRQLSDSAFTASGIAETLQHAYGIDPSALLRQQIIGFPGGRRTARAPGRPGRVPLTFQGQFGWRRPS